MKSIFLQEAEFGVDNPSIPLPKDKAQWDMFVQQELIKRFPELYGRPIETKLKEVSEEGNAFGAAIIKLNRANSDSEQLVFPIIIKEFKMYPPDLVNYNDKFCKASEDNIKHIINKEAIDIGVYKARNTTHGMEDLQFVTPDQNLNIMNPSSVFSGKSVVASIVKRDLVKVASLNGYLEDLGRWMPKYATSLANRPGAAAAFTSFIKQAKDMISSFKLQKMPTYVKAARLEYSPAKSSYELSYSYVYPNTNKVKLAKASYETLDEVRKTLRELDLPTKLADDMAYTNNSDLSANDQGSEILEDNETSSNPELGTAPVSVFDNTGKPHVGLLISDVVDFDLNKLPTKLFLSTGEPGAYAFADKIDAAPAPSSTGDLQKLVTPVEQGQTVAFILPSPDKPVATFPFKVLSVKNFNGHVAYVGKFVMREEAVTLLPSLITKTITPIDKADLGEMAPLVNTDKAYAMPEDLKAVSLDSALQLGSTKTGRATYIFKQAAHRPETLAKITRFGDGIKVHHCDFLNGEMTDKIACASVGIGHLYDKLCKLSREHKQVHVALPEYASINFKKHAAYTKPAKSLQINRENFVKAAAGINDESMSMLNLSLGLSDTSDSFKFSEYIDLFNDAIDKLGRLLLASRMGMDMSDSAALKLSVDALDSVIAQLRTL